MIRPRNWRRLGATTIAALLTLLTGTAAIATPREAAVTAQQHTAVGQQRAAAQAQYVCYRAHVQNRGDLEEVCDGADAGTTGEHRQLEAIKFWITPQAYEVCYDAHVQNRGWLGQICRRTGVGQIHQIGTTGQNLQLEAFKMDTTYGQICYQAYIENYGWGQGTWACDGSIAGLTGANLQIEAVRIKMNW